MKLYTSANSPFGARVTIAAQAKRVVIDTLPLPDGGLRSAAFLALNPIAKIPVLITEADTQIAESMVILTYLEERWPTPSLMPSNPEDRACINLLVQVVDTYVMAPVIRLFPHLAPATRDMTIVREEVARWRDGLAALAHFLPVSLPTAEAGLTMADCALPTALHLCTRIAGMLQLAENPVEAEPSLVDYARRTALHPLIGPVLTDLTRAQAKSDGAAGRPSVAHWHEAFTPIRSGGG